MELMRPGAANLRLLTMIHLLLEVSVLHDIETLLEDRRCSVDGLIESASVEIYLGGAAHHAGVARSPPRETRSDKAVGSRDASHAVADLLEHFLAYTMRTL